MTALSCSKLARPDYGTILPNSCMFGKTFAGERCFLHCAPGYKAVGKRVAVCDTDLKWHPKQPPKCVPAQDTFTDTAAAPLILKPFIKCPKDILKVIPKGHDTALVQIEKPHTNVDWYKYVDSHPSWAKRLEANLPAGSIDVVFRARSPNSNVADICRINIKVLGELDIN